MNSTARNATSMATLFSTPRSKHSVVAFDANSSMTWQDLQYHIAALTQALNANPATQVALCYGNSYQFTVGFFACCYAGKSIVLPGNYQPEALKALSEHFELLLHDQAISVPVGLPSLLTQVDNGHETTARNVSNAKIGDQWPMLDLDRITITLFTSGSSGKPKAIAKTLKQLDIEIAILDNLWGSLVNDSQVESTVSHQHIYGLLFRLLWPLCSARPFSCYNLEFPEQIAQCASRDTTLVSSPALLKRLNDQGNVTLVRCVFSSGGPLPRSAAIHSQQCFGDFPLEVFGSTETGGIAYRQQLSASQPWRLFPGIEAGLNHENCLKLRSPYIDENRWYQTADECYFHDNISFELRGRTDRIIKVEEKRVSLVEVEKRLEQLIWIDECAVIPLEEASRLFLCAVIALSAEGTATLQQQGKGKFWLMLRNALRDWLEPIAIPRKFRVADEVPLNSQGKRQTTEIEKLFQD